MKRDTTNILTHWKVSKFRKPLIIRGARQVGKTWVVREFGRLHFDSFVEINFELQSNLKSVFESLAPSEILKLLNLNLDQTIVPGKTLLFLDEIQECPKAISSLRYFFEQLPELHIICAGSLLEFVLGTEQLKMPVGRIDFLYMHPLSFGEYLTACGKQEFREYVKRLEIGQSINRSLSKKAEQLLLDYCFSGGMPRAVEAMVEHADLEQVKKEQLSIIQTYRQDFGKYQSRISPDILERTFSTAPGMIGEKYKYVRVDQSIRAESIKKALILLEKANVLKRVLSTSGKGLPLSIHQKENWFKIIFVDVGLMQCMLGVSKQLYASKNLLSILRGAVAEQFAGQQLLAQHDWFKMPELYYWHRQKTNSQAEVDYVCQSRDQVIPIEVKSGKSGTLKSLFLFMKENGAPFGIRLSLNPLEFKDNLLSIPLWGIESFYDRLEHVRSD